MEYELNIAAIIKQQLIDFDKMMVWSWGACKWIENMEEESLEFSVSGHHFHGQIKIKYTPEDLYLIQFIIDGNVLKEIDGVYCDQMNDVIDEFVERIPEYKR